MSRDQFSQMRDTLLSINKQCTLKQANIMGEASFENFGDYEKTLGPDDRQRRPRRGGSRVESDRAVDHPSRQRYQGQPDQIVIALYLGQPRPGAGARSGTRQMNLRRLASISLGCDVRGLPIDLLWVAEIDAGAGSEIANDQAPTCTSPRHSRRSRWPAGAQVGKILDRIGRPTALPGRSR
jgi:hypothetical protein